jgi:hypothetical protein
MPKASKKTASRVEDMGVMEGRYEQLGGYTIGFESYREDADATPLFKGLPDDRCQSPHWGYVVAGTITFHYADGGPARGATCTRRRPRRSPRPPA